jgi:hypothetical protein
VDTDELRHIVDLLSDSTNADPADEFPRPSHDANRPGLYAWFCDDDGLDLLSKPFATRLPPLIYAGQAGATSSRSLKESRATLRSRIRSNHVGGRLTTSTFRETLTAVLRQPLDLRLAGPRRLEIGEEARVSGWIRMHLRVSLVAVDDRLGLCAVEHAVLDQIDPHLNLMGMRPTPVRAELTRLRKQLRAES